MPLMYPDPSWSPHTHIHMWDVFLELAAVVHRSVRSLSRQGRSSHRDHGAAPPSLCGRGMVVGASWRVRVVIGVPCPNTHIHLREAFLELTAVGGRCCGRAVQAIATIGQPRTPNIMVFTLNSVMSILNSAVFPPNSVIYCSPEIVRYPP